MIILITGASHTGKTVLAQRMLEEYKYPYLSIDHLKMGLIRSENTSLTALEDDKLTDFLWPIVREIIKTAIENRQNLIVEGCYVPFNWQQNFDDDQLLQIRFICLAMSRNYIDNHFDDIMEHESDIETRMEELNCSSEWLKEENQRYIIGFYQAGEPITLIDRDYEKTIDNIIRCEL